MTDPTPEETTNSVNNSTPPQVSTEITISQPEESPANSQLPETFPSAVILSNLNLGARTMERSRLFVNNISTTIEEIQPFIEQVQGRTGIPWSFWLNRQRQLTSERTSPSQESNSDDSYVINVESSSESDIVNSSQNSSTDHSPNINSSADNYLNNIREAADPENQNNNNNAQDAYSSLNPEGRKLLMLLQKYIPFLLILVVKCIYDYKVKIIHSLVLFITTIQADSDLKREISKQQNRSHMALLGILFYITGCFVFVDFVFDQPALFSFYKPTTAWELLWSVAVKDFILKLVTIVMKIFLTCLPAKLIKLQSRGKYYLMLEAISQLYRSFAPIQPWLFFLYEAYDGVEKIFGIGLICIYVLSKGGDLLSRAKLFKHAVNKMMQQVSIGSFPTKSQLGESGGICTICHDEFSTPVRLSCSHIFCELCVITWLDRERSCPLCRAPITDNPIYRDGYTAQFIQLF